MFKLNSSYFCSLLDLSQGEFLFSCLKQLIEKQNDEISQLRNKLNTNPVENNGMVLKCLIVYDNWS